LIKDIAEVKDAIIGLFYILGLVTVPFLPETNGKPLPESAPSGLAPVADIRQA
jgi:hypothetical protein